MMSRLRRIQSQTAETLKQELRTIEAEKKRLTMLLEAKQKRIVPFALTVDREGHDYLKTICAGIGYEVVDDIEALPTRLPAIYRELAF